MGNRYAEKNAPDHAPVTWETVFADLFIQKKQWDASLPCRTVQIGTPDNLIYICPLFPGVVVWANEIHDTHLNFPEHDINDRNYAVINLCLEGCCEMMSTDERFLYVSEGMLNLNTVSAASGYNYPGGLYRGVEFALDLDVLQGASPDALTSYGLTVDVLQRALNAGNGNYTAMMREDSARQNQRLFDLLEQGTGSLFDYRFHALSLLYSLQKSETFTARNRFMLTKGQRRLATDAAAELTKDLGRHITIEALAARYHTSASSLKKYFEMVYGVPISVYLRRKRVEKASVLLTETSMRIGEIALVCGYESQSKFGSVFKSHTQVSPLEYRRLYKAAGNAKNNV